MAKIHYMKDKDGNTIYPVTHADAVLGLEDVGGNVDLSGYQTKTDNNLVTQSKDLVGAINELFQSADSGKQLIANAIGEPVSADDTFSAMSSDINSLLSSFKTNMMNNGVVVESNDKFKQLIDKIATMADSEGKGIQFAEGTFSVTMVSNYSTDIVINTNLDFTPSIVFITNPTNLTSLNSVVNNSQNNMIYMVGSQASAYIYSFDSNSIILRGMTYKDVYSVPLNGTWYAIGVGEEDTTLRDSLANILQDKGVDVTEEDDMASLIAKVDAMSEVRKTKEPYVFFEREGVVYYFHIDKPDEIMTFSFPTGTNNDINHIGLATCIIDGEEKLISVSKYYTGKIYVADLSNNTTSLYKSDAFVGIGNSNGDIGNIGSSNNGTRTLIYNMGTYAGAYAQSYGPPDYKNVITNATTGVQGYPDGIAGGFDGTKERLFVSSARTSTYLDEINPDTLSTIKTNSNASVAGSMACCNRNGNLYIYIYNYTNHSLVEFDSNTLKETGVVIKLNNTIPSTDHFAMMNVNVIKVIIDGNEYTILK